MASPTPLLYNTYYHIFNRGNNRENIFIEESSYAYFLNLYARYIDPVVDTFAYCLLRNHFHLLIKTKSEEEVTALKGMHQTDASGDQISKQFSHFFNAYSKAMNSAYGRTGSLFQHPFKRVIVSSDCQFWRVIAYIHQNPQKHKFAGDFRDWKWSSYRSFLSDKPTKLQRETVLDWFGGIQQYLDLHSQWVDDAKSKWLYED